MNPSKVYRCPHCKARFAANEGTSDYNHDCASGRAALDQEDRLAPDKDSFQWLGVANRLEGKDASIIGARLHSFTPRGNNAVTHETRQRTVHVNLTNMQYGRND